MTINIPKISNDMLNQLGFFPIKLYTKNIDRLSILYVFEKNMFDNNAFDLYNAMSAVNEKIVKDHRIDFEWHFTSNENIIEELILAEYEEVEI